MLIIEETCALVFCRLLYGQEYKNLIRLKKKSFRGFSLHFRFFSRHFSRFFCNTPTFISFWWFFLKPLPQILFQKWKVHLITFHKTPYISNLVQKSVYESYFTNIGILRQIGIMLLFTHTYIYVTLLKIYYQVRLLTTEKNFSCGLSALIGLSKSAINKILTPQIDQKIRKEHFWGIKD